MCHHGRTRGAVGNDCANTARWYAMCTTSVSDDPACHEGSVPWLSDPCGNQGLRCEGESGCSRSPGTVGDSVDFEWGEYEEYWRYDEVSKNWGVVEDYTETSGWTAVENEQECFDKCSDLGDDCSAVITYVSDYGLSCWVSEGGVRDEDDMDLGEIMGMTTFDQAKAWRLVE